MRLNRILLLTLVPPLLAIRAEPLVANDKADKQKSQIALSELPAPPQDVADLLKQGDVTMYVGQKPRRSNANDQAKPITLAAVTHFQLGFQYRCKTRWEVRYQSLRRVLTVHVTYSQIKLTKSHEIWFKKRPASDQFWGGKLVQHELDHVRLSSAATIEKQFRRRLNDATKITKDIDEDFKVTDAYTKKLVDAHVTRVFDDTIALVDIRYRELDRQTKHGIVPLPKDSSLAEWLR